MALPAKNLPEPPYSRTEVDLKLINLEQRIDSKLDRVLSEMREGFLRIENKFDGKFAVLQAEMTWLKWVTGGTFFLILGTLLAAAVKYLLHL